MRRAEVLRSGLLTAILALLCLSFMGFVAVVVSGHAPPEFTQKLRQSGQDSVTRVLQLLPGHHRVPAG